MTEMTLQKRFPIGTTVLVRSRKYRPDHTSPGTVVGYVTATKEYSSDDYWIRQGWTVKVSWDLLRPNEFFYVFAPADLKVISFPVSPAKKLLSSCAVSVEDTFMRREKLR